MASSPNTTVGARPDARQVGDATEWFCEPDDGQQHEPTAADLAHGRHWRERVRRLWAHVDADIAASASDPTVARFFEKWLQREHPGTAWRVRERLQGGRRGEAAPGKVGGSGASGVDDDPDGIAA